MKKFRADLHVHTVLSPCADVAMIPPLIVQNALEHNIDLIAITDHNSSANVRSVQKAAEGTNLTVLPGMEVQSREDVHLLALFENPEALDTWQEQVNNSLPDLPNQPEFFGEQFVVDETGDFIRDERRLLLTSTRFSIDEIFERVASLGGLVIPAHVERFSFGLFPTLGLISEKWHLLPSRFRVISPLKKPSPCFRLCVIMSLSRMGMSINLTIFSARQFLHLPILRYWRCVWHFITLMGGTSTLEKSQNPEMYRFLCDIWRLTISK